MMKLFLISIICLLHVILHAQDTIYKRSGELIPAKVLEINTKEISYKRTDLLEGPLFIVNKNDIKKIKYTTGTIDSFVVSVNPPSGVLYVNKHRKFDDPDYELITPTYRRGIYKHQKHHLSDRGVAILAMEKNRVWKNQEIESNVLAGRRNKAMQYSIGLGGLFVGGSGLMSSAIIADFSYNNSAQVAGLTALVSSGVVVASQIVSFQFKLRRVKNADRIAELYNQLCK